MLDGCGLIEHYLMPPAVYGPLPYAEAAIDVCSVVDIASSEAEAAGWIVQLAEDAIESGATRGDAEALLNVGDIRYDVKYHPDARGLMLVGTSVADSALVEADLRDNPNVEGFERDGVITAQDVPDDSLFGELYALENEGQTIRGAPGKAGADIGAVRAWDEFTTGSRDVVVAVIDSGIDLEHPELVANLWVNPGEIAGDGIDNDGNGYIDDVHGYDFVNGLENDGGEWMAAPPADDHGHGTHVAGIIGATGNNDEGVSGVNWSTSIMALKILDEHKTGTKFNALRALNYVLDMRTRAEDPVNVRITNNSYIDKRPDDYSARMHFKIKELDDAGVLFFAAAGNGSVRLGGADLDEFKYYPASYDSDNIVVVAAVDNRDQMWRSSNYGEGTVDIAAPGVGILSTDPTNAGAEGDYEYRTGTSMATPFASGVAALVWSQLPDATADEVRQALLDGSDELSWLQEVGGQRRLNAYGALTVDTYAPRANLDSANDIGILNPAPQTITVTYTDNDKLDLTKLDRYDLVVSRTTSEQFREYGVTVREPVELSADGHSVTVTYDLQPPGGMWDPLDNGAYLIHLQPSQVVDLANNAARPVNPNKDDLLLLGQFTVDVVFTSQFVVTSPLDTNDADPGNQSPADATGQVSLRSAVEEANEWKVDNTIFLPAGIYKLSIDGSGEDEAATGDLDIIDDLVIVGDGADSTIVDAGALDRVFHIHADVTVTLKDLSIVGGKVSGAEGTGGGIRNEGSLIVLDSMISDSQAEAGGGVANLGEMTITGSTLYGNSVSATGNGGGVFNAGTLTIANSTISDNTSVMGGGIYNNGVLTVNSSTIAGNTVDGLGFLPTGGPLLIATEVDGVSLGGGEVFDYAPQELTFRFSDGQEIDPNTLDGIVIRRAGGDGVVGNARDVVVEPGYLGVDSQFPNRVVARFAEPLPEDVYQIDIIGSGDGSLRNISGDPFDGDVFAIGPQDQRIGFKLQLAPQVTAVVPQPVSRLESQALTQASDQIVVYFSDDDLEPTRAADPNFYQLIATKDTATNADDVVFAPTLVEYDASRDGATLTFDSSIDALEADPGAFRLRIGTDRTLPVAPRQLTWEIEATSDFNTGGGVEIHFARANAGERAPEIDILFSKSDHGPFVPPYVSVVGNQVYVDLNSNLVSETSASELIDAINNDPNASNLLQASIVTGAPDTNITAPDIDYSPIRLLEFGSSFNTAVDVGTLGSQSTVVSARISQDGYPLDFPGGEDEPGHRSIPYESHLLGPADATAGIGTLYYNFRDE